MIQDIFPDRFESAYEYEVSAKEENYILIYKGRNSVLRDVSEGDFLLQLKDVVLNDTKNIELLGNSENSSYYITSFENIKEMLTASVEKEMRDIMYNLPKLDRWVINLGEQIFSWYNDNKFCGRCGNSFERKKDERALICPVCNNIVYPKISPAVIVGIIKDDKILLAQGHQFRDGFYSVIAGFTEPGETLEETVVREVKEETGLTLELENVQYYKSQPWPISSSMMIGFFAKYTGNEELNIDEEELADAAWFTRDELPKIPNNISISREIIDMYIDNKIKF